MRPVTVSAGPFTATAANNIRTASAVAGAGTLVLNGSLVSTGTTVANGVLAPSGVAVLDTPRRVIFTSSGNDSGITFTVTGTDVNGNTQTEVVTGSAGVTPSATVLDYKTIGPIVASGASAGTVAIGTTSGPIAASPWVRFDAWVAGGVAIQVDVSGTINYTVQQTLDDPNSPTNAVAAASMTWISSADAAVVAATTSQQSNYNFAPIFARVLINSATATTGSLTATFTQLGTPAR
jgi:hypothetical protein